MTSSEVMTTWMPPIRCNDDVNPSFVIVKETTWLLCTFWRTAQWQQIVDDILSIFKEAHAFMYIFGKHQRQRILCSFMMFLQILDCFWVLHEETPAAENKWPPLVFTRNHIIFGVCVCGKYMLYTAYVYIYLYLWHILFRNSSNMTNNDLQRFFWYY